MMIELIIKYLIIIVLVFCHEMGHILMCIIFFKCEYWKIDMGIGKVLFETKRLIIRPIINPAAKKGPATFITVIIDSFIIPFNNASLNFIHLTKNL